MAKAPLEIKSLAHGQTVATIAQMRAHVERICKANGIEINYGRHASASYLSDRNHGAVLAPEIWIRPVRSPRAYAVALHEMGHILGRHQRSQAVLVRERWAWDWARRNALDWTPAMQRHADWCLESYKRDDSNVQHKELTRPIGKPAGESFSKR